MLTKNRTGMIFSQRPLATFTLALVLLNWVSPRCQADPVAAAHFKSGLQLSQQKKWAQAEAAYRKAIALEPNNPTYRSYLADALAAQGQFENARASYAQEKNLKKRGFGSDPTRIVSNPTRPGRSAAQNPKLTNSGISRNLPQGFPRHGPTSNGTTTTTRRTGSDPLGGRIVIPTGERGSTRPPPNAGNDPFEKASQLFEQEKWPQAEAAYRQALRIEPTFDEGWKTLGDACARQNKWGEAEKAYRTAIRLNPQESYYHAQLASALLKLNRRDDAMKEAREAIRLGLENHEVFDDLGLMVHATG